MENNGTPKTISPRTKLYKEGQKNAVGFHIHSNGSYIGYYGPEWTLDDLVTKMGRMDVRLIGIMGNVLIFDK